MTKCTDSALREKFEAEKFVKIVKDGSKLVEIADKPPICGAITCNCMPCLLERLRAAYALGWQAASEIKAQGLEKAAERIVECAFVFEGDQLKTMHLTQRKGEVKMENRDRGKRMELQSGTKKDVLAALEHFLETEHSGRIGFEKDGESFSLWATSGIEPIIRLDEPGP